MRRREWLRASVDTAREQRQNSWFSTWGITHVIIIVECSLDEKTSPRFLLRDQRPIDKQTRAIAETDKRSWKTAFLYYIGWPCIQCYVRVFELTFQWVAHFFFIFTFNERIKHVRNLLWQSTIIAWRERLIVINSKWKFPLVFCKWLVIIVSVLQLGYSNEGVSHIFCSKYFAHQLESRF